jgi:hypothetical protein
MTIPETSNQNYIIRQLFLHFSVDYSTQTQQKVTIIKNKEQRITGDKIASLARMVAKMVASW